MPPTPPVLHTSRKVSSSHSVSREISRNQYGETSLHQAGMTVEDHGPWSCETGAAIAKKLLDAGADMGLRTNYEDHTPLHTAANEGSPGVVEVLLKYGADANTDAGGETPLHLAAVGSEVCTEPLRLQVVRLLLQYGADNAGNEYDCTPLQRALEYEAWRCTG
jgi:ankyrin repeat protein